MQTRKTHTHKHTTQKKQYYLFIFAFMLNVLTPNLRFVFCQTIKIKPSHIISLKIRANRMKFLSYKKPNKITTRDLSSIKMHIETHIETLIMCCDKNQIGSIFTKKRMYFSSFFFIGRVLELDWICARLLCLYRFSILFLISVFHFQFWLWRANLHVKETTHQQPAYKILSKISVSMYVCAMCTLISLFNLVRARTHRYT